MIVYEKKLFSFVVCLKYKKIFKRLSNLVKSYRNLVGYIVSDVSVTMPTSLLSGSRQATRLFSSFSNCLL